MNIDDIRAADARLDGHVRRTPLLSSSFLDEIAGKRVIVKPECLQHTGSFKFRGAWNAVSKLSDVQRKQGVIAFSSGNHAQGVAMAAKAIGAPSVIVMPSDAPRQKIDNTRTLGGEVILYDRATEDRDKIGARLANDRKLTLIKPFDNPDVIAGQGTVGLEVAEQARAMGIADARVLVPCGGGGLTSGIALALEADAPDFRVHPVEPEGFDDVARSLVSGQIERNPRLSGSICDAIITPSPGELTFPILKRLCGPGLPVPDDDCLRTMTAAFNHLKIVVEPGGAVALAAALYHADQIDGDTVIVVVSGGNVDAPVFADALTRFP
ncbi:serine/threonine dehydratase [Aliiroseovarius zhejiangensis]|uniref:Serine/threonine dehydratase n=1 Tax=Aliiroseovarius zhejiangensis TaxID=1632025 RepID=A0ABQ3IZ48_9RHOB|nr:threonine/serine dehydratase [Aliiroseovarius zhejiangensis]GHE97418.1 serine/threonine dehydratase [Aliiroseovarius zhejiangensis]